MSTMKEPAAKLPLAIRKNVRDEWDNKKPELETQLLSLLGVPWTFDINPLVIYPYAEVDSYGHNALGECIFKYVEGFIGSLKSFLQNHGEEGKNELNTVCHTHNITLGPSSAVNYCGTSITNGTLGLLFHPEKLAANIDDVGNTLAETISSAAQSEDTGLLSYAARHSIKMQYEPKIGDILDKCRKTLQNPDLKFEADFEELAKMLKGSKDAREDWETNIGDFAREYFDGFKQALEREGFGKDDLLREGFEEGCEKGTIRLKIVEKLKGGNGYNEVVLEDGEVSLQTTPEKWGVNISNAADKLVEIL